ncbi:SAFF domain-containing protein [Apiospora marii]|uniref:SAFF domain-containing protein n=1 Tax=Apiospora marii TaxID=335849 RepID=A0ABR1S9G2_9PEZI
MDDSMRVEYPAMLENLQPTQAAQALNDRVKRISKVNIEIADWLQERRKVEEQYVQAMRKLTQFRVPNAQSELGTFQIQWDKIILSTEAIAMSHHLLAAKIEKDVEVPLRNFHAKKEMQNMSTIQGNLQNMAKELDEAQKKSESVAKKAGKTSAAKMDQAASRLESATNQWESQAPFIFESLQALDETRLNQLRDVLTQYGTYEGEQAQQQQSEAESVLNSLLDFNTTNEIQAFVTKTTAGRPKLEKRMTTSRQASTIGATGSAGGAGAGAGDAPSSSPVPPPMPPVPQTPEDSRSVHSGPKEDKGSENKLRSRIGTMLGRRRQSVHGGFGQLSPPKGPFSRTSKSAHGPSPRASSSNLNESHNRLSSLIERPDMIEESTKSPETNGKTSHEGANGSGGDAANERTSGQLEPSHMNGTNGGAAMDVGDVLPLPGPPPGQQEAEKDAEGFTIPPTRHDPISEAEREAAGDETEPAFKLNIQKEPVAEEDPEERQAALSKFTNSLSALGTPARKTGTIRGRRDVRNTIYVPAPVSEGPSSSNPFPPTPSLPSAFSKPPTTSALVSEPSVTGTSDTQSIRSSNSLGNHAHFKHPDLHEPGLCSSFMETVSATFERGNIKSAKISGEIAFSYNPEDSANAPSHETIRINNFPALESIGPNRIFVTNTAPDQPDHFTLDLSHLRPSQPTVGFSYRLHVEEANPPLDHVPLIVSQAWKPQGDKLGLLLQYKLNPAFKFKSNDAVTLHNVVIYATYEGKASGAQTKPQGTHLKDKHLVYWRLGDVTLSASQDWQKVIARIVGEGGIEPQAGTVEARWEFISKASLPQDIADITLSRLEESKGKEVELTDDDPFADVGESTSTSEEQWHDVPAVRKLVSGKYESLGQ